MWKSDTIHSQVLFRSSSHPLISPLLSLTLIHPQDLFRPAHSSTLKTSSVPHTNPLISPFHVPHPHPPSSPFPSLNLIHSQVWSVPQPHPLSSLFRPSHSSTHMPSSVPHTHPPSSPITDLRTHQLPSPLPSFPPSHLRALYRPSHPSTYNPSLFITPIHSQTLSIPSQFPPIHLHH